MKIFILLLTLFFTQPAYADIFLADQKTAQIAYKNKEYKSAYKHWQALKDFDDPKTNIGLGRLYARGLSVKQDHKKALSYFQRAADQNDPKAYYEIGFAYEKGRGVKADIDKAKKWYQLSINAGYQRAENRLAKLENRLVLEITQKEKSKWWWRKSIKSQLAVEDNLTLGEDQDSATAFINEGQVTARYQPIQDIRLQTQIRAVHSTGSATSNQDDDNDDIMDESFVELRQTFVEFRNIGGHAPLKISAGRQRFQEDRRLWWNDEVDALKLSYGTTLTSGFIALGNNFSDYRFGDDQEMEAEDEKRLRLLGEITHHLSPNHNIEGRFLYENDYSNSPDIGAQLKAEDIDRRDQNVLWVGMRTNGLVNSSVSYDTSLIGVFGKEDIISTSTAPNNQRRVAGKGNRDVRAFAFDGRLTKERVAERNINAHIAYAFGSGDDGKGANTAFRQTDLETNTSAFDRERRTSATRHYGEVLRPELSNIHIINLGLQTPIFDHHDINVNYYSYWRANSKTGLGNNGIDQRLNNSDSHIGQAIDITSTIDLSELFPNTAQIFDQSYLRVRAGSFYSGAAYGVSKNEFALIGNAQINVKF